jgi:polyferredoxin
MRVVTQSESRDTGMAMVLVLLILHLATGWPGLVPGALAVLVLTMTVPRAFGPVAVVWLGFAHLLGTVMSTVLLSLVFALVVTPIGLVRRLAGKDSLQLRRFKVGTESVMRRRDHTFAPADLERPY